MGDLRGDLATLHWDGETWKTIHPVIPADFVGAEIAASPWHLAVAGTDEVWLFGDATSIGDGRQQAWRWDGEQWVWVETKL
jgi:hypothetical protein